jgi:excisionase family DNA binding protein
VSEDIYYAKDKEIAALRPNYTVAQLAERLQVSGKTIYGMISRGELRAFKFGGSIRIRAEEVARIEGECGSSNTGDIGRLQESTGTGSNGADRYAPVIAPPPSACSTTINAPRRGTR